MATPSQIRNERKKVLRQVKRQLKELDSQQEAMERQINRILKVKKRLPDLDDAQELLIKARSIDQQLDKVIAEIGTFSNFVRTT